MLIDLLSERQREALEQIQSNMDDAMFDLFEAIEDVQEDTVLPVTRLTSEK